MRKLYFLAGIIAIVALGREPRASADFSQRSDSHAAASLKVGLGLATLPVLMRQVADPEATRAALLARLCAGCSVGPAEQVHGRTRTRGDGWHLDVFGDGSLVEFVDETVASRAHALGVDAQAAFAPDDLEAAGRAYIASKLGGTISLAANESLVVDGVTARKEGGVSRAGTMAPTLITATRILFTREIAGTPVVGNGSKIAVTFLADGSVESFRYDWPTYLNTGRTQRAAATSELLSRVQRVVIARSGGSTSLPMPLNTGTAAFLQLTPEARLERFSCGYYDPGLMERNSAAPIQAGCFYHATHTLGAGPDALHAGFSGAVPAAAQAEADDAWAEEAMLRRAAAHR